MHEMLFRAHVLGSKELNRGHVTQNNKSETSFVGLIPLESSACTGCVCQYNLRDKDHDFLSQLASEDRRCDGEVVWAVEPCKMLPGDAIDVEARVKVPCP